MEQYDVVFLGCPIWWGEAPKIVYTFLESYDLDGKTIVPFCTSGSSGVGSSAKNLHPLAGTFMISCAGDAAVSGVSLVNMFVTILKMIKMLWILN